MPSEFCGLLVFKLQIGHAELLSFILVEITYIKSVVPANWMQQKGFRGEGGRTWGGGAKIL